MSKVKKIVLPWLLALVMVMGSCLPVMATELSTLYLTAEEFLQDDNLNHYGGYNFEYYTVLLYENQYIFLFSSAPFYVNPSGDNYEFYTNCYTAWDVYNSSDGTTLVANVNWHHSIHGWAYMTYPAASLVLTNYDVLDYSSGDLVFQHPASLLVVVTQEIQPETLLREILTMTPLLVPLLAGYLGLRKALNFLSTILKTA